MGIELATKPSEDEKLYLYPQDIFDQIKSGELSYYEFKSWYDENIESACLNGYSFGISNSEECFGIVPA